jgi:hypothetical protein
MINLRNRRVVAHDNRDGDWQLPEVIHPDAVDTYVIYELTEGCASTCRPKWASVYCLS